jgi:hypothetical protein
MKINDLYLILLLIIFIILSIFYIINVCDYNIREMFVVEISGDTAKNCVLALNDVNKCVDGSSSCEYSDKFLSEDTAPRYHEEYSCANIKSSYIGSDLSVDSVKLLLTQGCVKLSPLQIQNYLSTNIAVETEILEHYFDIIKESTTANLTHYLRDKIRRYIKNNTGVDNISKFPIYACISQAPYLKDNNESTIVWDHNRGQPISHYKKGCSLGTKNDETDLCVHTHKMFIQILLIFFKNDCEKINKFIDYINLDRNKSSSLQCNINCGNSDRVDGLACGCLNKQGSYDDGAYNSICKTGTANVDYSVIYYVNPHYNFEDEFNKTIKLCEPRY